MKSVIGLTKTGVELASLFEQYPQYSVYKISTHVKRGAKKCHALKERSNPEEYDAKPPRLKTFFKDVDEEVLFIVSGDSIESAASLQILYQLRDKKIDILYFIPDEFFMNDVERLNERAVYHILQEYARSGMVNSVCLVDGKKLEEMLADKLTIENHNDIIGEYVVSSYHMMNVFTHTEAALANASPISEISRVNTFGVAALGSTENLLFSLDNVREKEYYFAIQRDKMNSRETLANIKQHIKENNTNESVNYYVHPTSYDEDYVYTKAYSSVIQERNK